MSDHLSPAQLARDLALPDLTDRRSAGPHAIQLLITLGVAALERAWHCDVRWCRGPRVVPITDNYDALAFTADAASRDRRYTRYVDDVSMLRSHSSAMVPPALRSLATLASPPDDVLLVCPGIVYRRDAIDRLHTGTPHQLDLWRITRQRMGSVDMDDMTTALIDALVPGATYRVEDRVHPYTLDGRQVDVLADGEWIEVWECGIAHPDVLTSAGLDPTEWHGLALGLGLDRLLMLRKGIPDIRLLRSTDGRVVAQLRDLSPYRPVSSMPAVVRDLSVAVDAGSTTEDLGDRVRSALGDDAAAIESVEVRSTTPYDDLPRQAIERLGMSPQQQNVLVRVVLRDLDRTLTDDEANVLRDRIYAALHQGSAHQWAVR